MYLRKQESFVMNASWWGRVSIISTIGHVTYPVLSCNKGENQTAAHHDETLSQTTIRKQFQKFSKQVTSFIASRMNTGAVKSEIDSRRKHDW
jgi:hypothetical protein